MPVRRKFLLLLAWCAAGAAALAGEGAGPDVAALVQSGDASVPNLPFPGFGRTGIVAAAWQFDDGQAWEKAGATWRRRVGDYEAILRTAPAQWRALRKGFPTVGPEDRVVTKRILWSGVSAWLVDLTRGAGAPPATARQRHLVAAAGGGFVHLALQGPPGAFEAARADLRACALAVRFRANGLVGAYHRGVACDALAALQIDPVVDFDWGGGGPRNGVEADRFSVRWTGTLLPQHTERYALSTVTDDGIRVWVAGRRIIDNWTDHGATEDRAAVELKAGTPVPIKVEFYENGGSAVVRLFWESPSQKKAIIPARCLVATPQPGFRPAPRVIAPDPEGAQMPELLGAERPGGYAVRPAAGLAWQGEVPHQHLTLGTGAGAVQVELRWLGLGAAQARGALPPAGAVGTLAITPMIWRSAAGWRAVTTPGGTAPAVHGRIYLVPLQQGLLRLAFRSPDAGWYARHREGVRAVLASIAFTKEMAALDTLVGTEVF